MNVYIVSEKSKFTAEQIVKLELVGKVFFVDTSSFTAKSIPQDSEEKILMLSPGCVNWNLSNEIVDEISNLKAICVPSTSFSWIDGVHLKEKGISLINVPKYSTESVAEYAISLMLNVAKKLPLILKSNWKIDYNLHKGWEVKGKTMGIIGLGTIGKRIAELGQNMGMNLIYWSKNSRDDRFEYQELDEVMKHSDFIFPALAKNSETSGLVSKEKINLMKQDSFIVSITGIDVFDFEHALSKVKEGILAGIALESEEKKLNDFEGNVWVTPPIAWYTKEAVAEDYRIWVENVTMFAKGQPQNVVN
jgi:glycerate dehydrogenase